MSHPAADRIVGLYQDRAADWIRDRGAALRQQHEGDWDEGDWLNRFTADWPPAWPKAAG